MDPVSLALITKALDGLTLRSEAIARNIANADTPGYQAQHIAAFQDTYSASGPANMRATRPGHATGAAQGNTTAVMAAFSGEPSPNGNTVSLEEELLSSVAVSREHNRALTIYRHAMTVLRTTLGRS